MSVCDPIDGLHAAFGGLLPQQVFAPRPPALATATREGIAEWRQSVETLAVNHSDELAAIIVEPVLQGAGGMFAYPAECVRILRSIADQHGLLLILDEIATGFGRTGELFAAQHASVVPDILCVGKALTGGYVSLAAMLCTGQIARTVSSVGPLLHGPTFMGNPLACAVANASLRILDGGAWRGDVRRIGEALVEGLAPARALDAVVDVRTIGAVGVVELAHDVDVPTMTRAAIRRGVWVRPFRNLVYAMPPYISTNDDVGTITRGIVAAVAEVHGVPKVREGVPA
jgi:adenosylmethionine-8-amino-7-oxononanoate aminotransferase